MSLYENKIVLKGFLGKDAETKTISKDRTFVVLSVATKSGFKSKETGQWVDHTEWHRVVAFGLASEMAKGLKKGDYVEIEGELRSSEFDQSLGDGEAKVLAKRRSWEVRAVLVRRPEVSTRFSPDQSMA